MVYISSRKIKADWCSFFHELGFTRNSYNIYLVYSYSDLDIFSSNELKKKNTQSNIKKETTQKFVRKIFTPKNQGPQDFSFSWAHSVMGLTLLIRTGTKASTKNIKGPGTRTGTGRKDRDREKGPGPVLSGTNTRTKTAPGPGSGTGTGPKKFTGLAQRI